jgi:hypothetical protein
VAIGRSAKGGEWGRRNKRSPMSIGFGGRGCVVVRR